MHEIPLKTALGKGLDSQTIVLKQILHKSYSEKF